VSTPDGELIPAAIEALVALWKAALPDVQVLDGDPTTWTAGVFLTVGIGADDVTNEATVERPGLRRRSDYADITNALWAAGGDTSIPAYRDRAFTTFRAARTALQADQKLGGAVTRAELTSYAYQPRRTPRGAGAQIQFTVRAAIL
jgi:hypothetical protein